MAHVVLFTLPYRLYTPVKVTLSLAFTLHSAALPCNNVAILQPQIIHDSHIYYRWSTK